MLRIYVSPTVYRKNWIPLESNSKAYNRGSFGSISQGIRVACNVHWVIKAQAHTKTWCTGMEQHLYSPADIPKTKHTHLGKNVLCHSLDLVSSPQETAGTAGGWGLVHTVELNACEDATKIWHKGAPHGCTALRGRCFKSTITFPQPQPERVHEPRPDVASLSCNLKRWP